MKITGIRTQPYQIEMKRPIGDSNNPVGGDTMLSNALWLDTDEGLSGIAIGGAPGGAPPPPTPPIFGSSCEVDIV